MTQWPRRRAALTNKAGGSSQSARWQLNNAQTPPSALAEQIGVPSHWSTKELAELEVAAERILPQVQRPTAAQRHATPRSATPRHHSAPNLRPSLVAASIHKFHDVRIAEPQHAKLITIQMSATNGLRDAAGRGGSVAFGVVVRFGLLLKDNEHFTGGAIALWRATWRIPVLLQQLQWGAAAALIRSSRRLGAHGVGRRDGTRSAEWSAQVAAQVH